MSTKSLAIISGVAAGLMLVAVMIRWGGWRENKKPEKLFRDQITEFRINDLSLTKNEDGWWVSWGTMKVPADKEIVENLVKRFEEIELGQTVSENRDRWGELGIGESQTVILEIGGKKLEIGKIAADYQGTFVRDDEGRWVYKTAVVLDKTNLTSFDYWRQKMVTNLPRFQIKRVTVNSREIKSQKIIDKACSLAAEKYLAGFSRGKSVTYQITIETENDKQNLIVGKEKAKRPIYWATTDEKKYFEIKKGDFDLLTVNPR